MEKAIVFKFLIITTMIGVSSGEEGKNCIKESCVIGATNPETTISCPPPNCVNDDDCSHYYKFLIVFNDHSHVVCANIAEDQIVFNDHSHVVCANIAEDQMLVSHHS
ncbi:hypothetical protein L1987_08761 [Smallanthus sonchifolius]|uniref:Uncharacterized protein n=1 Tax=Smallanthus sonchifolius TaxID=185202 RepID=A0ACB9JPA8_9ASTR|nr:hypothetical protein L1987_08761 [Smallanthus sonchifolius]